MLKVINFRCFLITAVSSIISILLADYLGLTSAVICLTVLSLIFVALIVFCAVANKAVECATFVLCLIVAVLSGAGVIVTKNNWANKLNENREYNFTGKVSDISFDTFSAAFLITDVFADGESINGNVYLTVNVEDGVTASFLKRGDRIYFNAEPRFNDIFAEETDGYSYRNNIRYYAETSESTIEFINADPSFFDNLKNDMSTALNKNLGAYGPVAFGMITGEKGSVEDDVRDYYSVSGLGHILAVSGLHIGFVTLIVGFLLKIFHAGKIVSLALTSVVLTFYCFLASFSPSVVRASVMCITGLIAMTFGKQKDTLNTLCFAVSLILAVKPLYLFDVGFQMSVAAVFGILLFSRSFERIFSKILPNFLSSSLSASLSAQIGITPIILIYFHNFPLYSVFTNMLVIPLVTVAFIAIVFGLVVAMLIPSAEIILTVAGIPLVLVDTVAEFVAALPLADIRIFAYSLLFAVFILYFICSNFFMMPKFKPLVIIACVLVTATGVIYMNIPLSYEYNLICCEEYGAVTSLIRHDGKIYAVGDVKNYYSVNEMMYSVRGKRIDAIFVNSLSADVASGIVEINEKYKVGAVYFPESEDYSGMYELLDNGIPFYRFSDALTEEYSFLKPVGIVGFAGYKYCSGKVSVLLLGRSQDVSDVAEEDINSCALIRAYTFDGDFGKRVYIVNYENQYAEDEPLREVVLKGKTAAVNTENGMIKYL